MDKRKYLGIIRHYESCLRRHGDTHRGVDWPDPLGAETRYEVMLGLIPADAPRPVSLLDFGCGASHLFEYIQRRRPVGEIVYSGLDLSEDFVKLSQNKFPSNRYYQCDVLVSPEMVPEFDYIVMNGVFTEKIDLSFDEMWAYFKELTARVFEKARLGMAFNVMSKHVDWERPDLFHLSFDSLAEFLTRSLTRNFVFRNDYGLYEYTVYVHK